MKNLESICVGIVIGRISLIGIALLYPEKPKQPTEPCYIVKKVDPVMERIYCGALEIILVSPKADNIFRKVMNEYADHDCIYKNHLKN